MTLKLNRVQGVGKTERTETSWIRLSVRKAGERHPQAGKDGAGIAEGTGAPSSQRSGGRMEGTPTRDGHAHGVSATRHVLGVGGSAALVPVRPSHGRVAPARLQRLWVEPARAREPRVADGRSPWSPVPAPRGQTREGRDVREPRAAWHRPEAPSRPCDAAAPAWLQRARCLSSPERHPLVLGPGVTACGSGRLCCWRPSRSPSRVIP